MRRTITNLLAAVMAILLFGPFSVQAQWLDNMVGDADYNLNQNGEVGTSGYNSYERYKSTDATYLYGYAAADDIYRKSWGDQTFSQIYVKGSSSNDAKYLKGFNVVFYSDMTDYMSLMPGDTAMYFPNHQSYIYDPETGDVVLYFETPITLTRGGYYWMSIQAVSDYSSTAEKFDWKWDYLADTEQQKYQKPYYKGTYSATNIPDKDWKYVNSYGNSNFAYSMHTAFTDDLAVQMISPTTVDLTSDAVEIGVKVYNIGENPASNFTLSYSINGGDTVDYTVTEELASYEFKNYAFPTTADMSAEGEYNVNVFVSYDADVNELNDNNFKTLSNYGLVHNVKDLNGQSVEACSGLVSDPGGPGEDIKDGNTYTMTLLPSSVDKRVSLELTYMNRGTLTIYDGEDNSAPVLVAYSNVVSEDTVVHTATNGTGALTVSWRGASWGTYGFLGSASCVNPPVNDLAITEIISPEAFATTDAEVVTVKVKNFGSAEHTDVAVSYTLDDATPVSETIASIGAGEEVEYSFTATFDATTVKKYDLSVSVELTDDEDADNNSISMELVNYGDVYRPLNLLDDTVKACSGVLTDDGGLDGNSSTTMSIGYSTTIVKSDDPNTRIQFEIDHVFGSYMNIYDLFGEASIDNTDDVNKLMVRASSNVFPEGKFSPLNPEGAFLVVWSLPYGFGFPPPVGNYEIPITCVPVQDNDLAAAYIEVEEKMFRINEEISVNALVANIGKNAYTSDIYLVANSDTVATIAAAQLAVDSVMPVELMWTPQTAGHYDISVVTESDDDDTNNSTSLHIVVSNPRNLATSFEWLDKSRSQYELPEFWGSVNGAGRVKQASNHGKYAATVTNDTLLTPELLIKEGDEISFFIKAEKFDINGAVDGNYSLGYFGVNTGMYYDLETGSTMAGAWEYKTIELAGLEDSVIRFAFVSSDGSSVDIDYVTGPELYFKGYDLEITNLDVKTLVTAGQTTMHNVSIRSLSEATVSGDTYMVELYMDDNDMPFATSAGVELELNTPTVVSIDYAQGMVGEHSVYAKVVMEEDVDMTNNMSAFIPVRVIDGGLTLSDNQDAETELTTDDVPVGTSYKYSISEILIDADSIKQTGIIKGMSFPRDADSYDQVDSIMMEVYLNHTDDTSLGAGWILPKDLVKVFEGYVNLKEGEKELYIPFDTDFTYTGGNVVALFNNSSKEGNPVTNFKRSEGVTDTIALYNYYNNWNADGKPFVPADSVEGDNRYPHLRYMVYSSFIFEAASSVTVEVNDGSGAKLADAVVELQVGESTIYSDSTDAAGVATFSAIGLNTYDVVVYKDGYEKTTVAGTVVGETAVDLGIVVIEALAQPADIAVVVDNAAKSAVATWNTAKAFASYTVYLNGEMVAENVTEGTYTFTDLADGMHTVGVTSIYDGGMSAMSTKDFYVVYAPMNLEVKLLATNVDAYGTWEFEGTSDDFYGFIVSQEGVSLDTVMTMFYEFTGLVEGDNVFDVSAYYMNGGESAKATYTLNVPPAVGVDGLNSVEFNVYPNPASDYVTLQGVENATVQVVNVTGVVVLTQNINSNSAKIDVSNLNSGIYFIKVNNENGSSVKRLTIK